MTTRRKAKAPAAPAEPVEGYRPEMMAAHDLEAVAYLPHAYATGPDGTRYSLPETLIRRDGRALVQYRRAGDGNYSFDGWEPVEKRGPWGWQHGGRYPTLSGALGWLAWVARQRALDSLAVQVNEPLTGPVHNPGEYDA